MIDREAVRVELEKAFDARTSAIMLGVLERVASQVHAAGTPREDFSELKAIVTRLVERMDQAAARSDQFEARMDQLTARLDQLTERVEQLTIQLIHLTEDLERFKQDTANNFAGLKGLAKEQDYRERGATIFGLLLRKGRNASNMVADALHDAVKQARLSIHEAKDILAADMFWSGEYNETQVVLVGEISWTVDSEDVERAARLQTVGFRALPFVGGEKWTNDAKPLASSLGVLTASDGTLDLESWEQMLEKEKPR